MEIKFPKLLQKYGVTAEQTTVKIREAKKAFDEAWEEYNELVERYEAETDPDEKQTLMEEVNEYEDAIEGADAEMVKKIEHWNRNKDSWARTNAAMQEGRKARHSAKAATSPEKASAPKPSYSNTPDPHPVAAAASTTAAATSTQDDEEGMSGWGWVLGLGLAVLTLGVGAKFLKRS